MYNSQKQYTRCGAVFPGLEPPVLTLEGTCSSVGSGSLLVIRQVRTKNLDKPVLATSHIRPLNQALKSTFPSLSQLADSPEEEYNRNVFICSSSKGVIYTVLGILFFIKRLTRLCLQSLHHHFIHWTKPDTATPLIAETLTDLARSKFELVAENALLRQQLLILRRHTKRPVCATTDRMLLVFLARMVRTWKHARITRSTRDALAVASSGIQAVLAVQVQSGCAGYLGHPFSESHSFFGRMSQVASTAIPY